MKHMAKTALRKLQSMIQDRIAMLPNNPTVSERAALDAYVNCLNWAKGLEPVEKEQIVSAVIWGIDVVDDREAEEYYNEVYNK